MKKPTKAPDAPLNAEHGAVAFLRATIDLQVAILALVLPVLERGNASYHAMQCTRKERADCPTLGPLVKLVRDAIGGVK